MHTFFKITSLLTFLFLMLVAFPQEGKAAVVIGAACSTLGETTITTDNKNLAACLKDSTGGLYWKSMTYSCKVYSGVGPCACPFGLGTYGLYCLTNTGAAGPTARTCSGSCYNDCEGAPIASAEWCSCMARSGLNVSWQFTSCE